MNPPPPPPRHWAPPPRRDGNHAQFVDSFETSTEVQLVLELLSGGTLLGLLERQGKLPEAHARKVVCEIASGLAALHLIGVVHRDLKPENVLFDGAGRAKLCPRASNLRAAHPQPLAHAPSCAFPLPTLLSPARA